MPSSLAPDAALLLEVFPAGDPFTRIADREGAFVLRPCRQVHTVGMRFAIDVAFCDRDGVVRRTATLRPGRVSRPCLGAAWAIEAEAGAFARWGLAVGDRVELRG